jgi:hypothetical protein
MTKEQIATIAGYEIYANLVEDFCAACDIEGETIKHKAGSLYAQLYANGGK